MTTLPRARCIPVAIRLKAYIYLARLQSMRTHGSAAVHALADLTRRTFTGSCRQKRCLFITCSVHPRPLVASAAIEYEWVEILEPETKRKMYANVKTGDCLWEAPSGVPV